MRSRAGTACRPSRWAWVIDKYKMAQAVPWSRSPTPPGRYSRCAPESHRTGSPPLTASTSCLHQPVRKPELFAPAAGAHYWEASAVSSAPSEASSPWTSRSRPVTITMPPTGCGPRLVVHARLLRRMAHASRPSALTIPCSSTTMTHAGAQRSFRATPSRQAPGSPPHSARLAPVPPPNRAGSPIADSFRLALIA